MQLMNKCLILLSVMMVSCTNMDDHSIVMSNLSSVHFFKRVHTLAYKESPNFFGGPTILVGVMKLKNNCLVFQSSSINNKLIEYQLLWPWDYSLMNNNGDTQVVDAKKKKVISLNERVTLHGGMFEKVESTKTCHTDNSYLTFMVVGKLLKTDAFYKQKNTLPKEWLTPEDKH